jgi:hypothetical protein
MSSQSLSNPLPEHIHPAHSTFYRTRHLERIHYLLKLALVVQSQVDIPDWKPVCNRPKVLLAAKTDGSVFYDKLSPSIARGKW